PGRGGCRGGCLGGRAGVVLAVQVAGPEDKGGQDDRSPALLAQLTPLSAPCRVFALCRLRVTRSCPRRLPVGERLPPAPKRRWRRSGRRSEEHTSELQS